IVGTQAAALLWTAPGTVFTLTSLVIPAQLPPFGVVLSDALSISDTGFIACTGTVPNTSIPSQAYLLAPSTPPTPPPPPPLTTPHPPPPPFPAPAAGAPPLPSQRRRTAVPLATAPPAGGGIIPAPPAPPPTISPAPPADAGSSDCLITSPCDNA